MGQPTAGAAGVEGVAQGRPRLPRHSATWRSVNEFVSTGAPLHHTYLQATTMSFGAIVACQVGTAFAARTAWAPLKSIGVTTNRLLLGGIAFELAFASAVIYLPPLQVVFGCAALDAWMLLVLIPMPVAVWGIDENYRWWVRQKGTTDPQLHASRRKPEKTSAYAVN